MCKGWNGNDVQSCAVQRRERDNGMARKEKGSILGTSTKLLIFLPGEVDLNRVLFHRLGWVLCVR